jgi:hypothetical protein
MQRHPETPEGNRTNTLQPTCYPYDCSAVNENGELFGGSSRIANARTRLNFALN